MHLCQRQHPRTYPCRETTRCYRDSTRVSSCDRAAQEAERDAETNSPSEPHTRRWPRWAAPGAVWLWLETGREESACNSIRQGHAGTSTTHTTVSRHSNCAALHGYQMTLATAAPHILLLWGESQYHTCMQAQRHAVHTRAILLRAATRLHAHRHTGRRGKMCAQETDARRMQTEGPNHTILTSCDDLDVSRGGQPTTITNTARLGGQKRKNRTTGEGRKAGLLPFQ